MTKGNEMEREQRTPRAAKRALLSKKPYVKPTCISEKIYETLALACGKLPGQGGRCDAAPRRS